MAQWIKCLLHKNQDLASDPQSLYKATHSGADVYPNTRVGQGHTQWCACVPQHKSRTDTSLVLLAFSVMVP